MKLLPHDKEAEQGVLGAVLHNNDALEQVSGMVTPEMFFSPGHRMIFKAMVSLAEKEVPIDEITIRDEMGADLEKAGGRIYLMELLDTAPVTANVLVYAEIVLEKWRAREFIEAAQNAARAVMDAGKLGDRSAAMRNALDAIEMRESGIAGRTIGDAVKDAVIFLEDKSQVPFRAKFWIPRLDRQVGGLGGERPTIIAAKTGVGKTLFMGQTARLNAEHGVGVLFFNLEMDERTIALRALSSTARINGSSLLHKELDDFTAENWDSLAAAQGKLSGLPLHIKTPRFPMAPDQLLTTVAWYQRNHGIGLVVIDHLAKIGGSKLDYQGVTDRMLGVVSIVRRLGIPVLLGVMLRDEQGAEPRISMLKGSGDISENADTVIMLHDPEPEQNGDRWMDVIIGKNAHGKTGRLKPSLWLQPDKFTISEGV